MNKVHKPSGTTHRIREQLNFSDDKKWKQFSSRRLELIDKFNLSERKASEQDENIRQIANILRTEFGYPTTTSSEFEKLVTAAVQSVRRNRKRSTKTRSRRSEMSSATSDEDSLISRTTSPLGSSSQNAPSMVSSLISQVQVQPQFQARTQTPVHAQAQAHSQAQSQIPPPPAPVHIAGSSVRATTPVSSAHHLQAPLLGSVSAPAQTQTQAQAQSHGTVPIIQPKPIRMVYKSNASLHQQVSNSNTFKQNYDEFMKDVIKDLTTGPINLQKNETESKQHNSLADLALSTHDFSLLNLALSNDKKGENAAGSDGTSVSGSNSTATQASQPASISQNQQNTSSQQQSIPFFLREKLMHFIQNSKTLTELTTSLNLHEMNNLLKLGQYVLLSSISFVLEKFFSNLSMNSIDYIHDKLSSPDSLSEMCIKLIGSGTKRNLNQLPLEWRVKLLNFIVGSVVKDFGFDPCVYPLTEIFHDSILKKYPLVCNEGKNQGSNSFKNAVIASLPLKPEMANKDMNKKVVIKFGEKEQRFVFHLLSNGAPTIQEILENSSNLFQINREKFSSLTIYHQNEIVKDDAQLASLLNGFSNQEIVLEIKGHSAVQNSSHESSAMNGLQILSSVSQVAAENSSSSPACLTTLDNIISRISSPISTIKKEDSSISPLLHPPSIPNKHGKNFVNGLPQPVFQPLL
ncbi:transcription factor VHR1 [Kluyveromyces marxianus]|uniref:Transcription factor VHR1 n=1 Tax=Kluyveromyces marxianus TaxID=4911 RepID=A0ABX6F4A4_KLUMA|nr:transcription factor VHR1 [Kluyveromyces marxianus]